MGIMGIPQACSSRPRATAGRTSAPSSLPAGLRGLRVRPRVRPRVRLLPHWGLALGPAGGRPAAAAWEDRRPSGWAADLGEVLRGVRPQAALLREQQASPFREKF